MKQAIFYLGYDNFNLPPVNLHWVESIKKLDSSERKIRPHGPCIRFNLSSGKSLYWQFTTESDRDLQYADLIEFIQKKEPVPITVQEDLRKGALKMQQ